MHWILHSLSEQWDQMTFLPYSTLLLFHTIQPRKAYSNHKSALILLQRVLTNLTKTTGLQWGVEVSNVHWGNPVKERSRSELWPASALTSCVEWVLSHLFCSRDRFSVQKYLKAGNKVSVALSSCVSQKASAITNQAEEVFLRGKNNWGGKRNAENMREMQRISQS